MLLLAHFIIICEFECHLLPEMRTHILERQVWIFQPIGKVFAFFSEAHNLNAITPQWLNFEILTPAPIKMTLGAIIDYKLLLYGKTIQWQTEITHWEPPGKFIDTQRRGPYRSWIHEHTFTEKDPGTLMHDLVRYAVPGGLFDPLVHRVLVSPNLKRIFDYRQKKLREIFSTRQTVWR